MATFLHLNYITLHMFAVFVVIDSKVSNTDNLISTRSAQPLSYHTKNRLKSEMMLVNADFQFY